MFRHQGSARSERQNRLLAGYLAFVGGFVNSVGFVLIGTFTSHVTGIVGRATHDYARGEVAAGMAASTMVIAFFTGAFIASVIVESSFFGQSSRAYGVALGMEGLLLSGFAAWSGITWVSAHPRLQDAQGLLLCVAMGMQNSLVTRLSGAVVRTTHLTGVITDLGIETARWFRYWRRSASSTLRVRLVMGANAAELPHLPKFWLLLTIAVAFVLGAGAGSLLVGRLAHTTMLVAAALVFVFAVFAYLDGGGRSKDEVITSRR
jgi:uncharacterized membrane protein YoaK (UPF0700 family)